MNVTAPTPPPPMPTPGTPEWLEWHCTHSLTPAQVAEVRRCIAVGLARPPIPTRWEARAAYAKGIHALPRMPGWQARLMWTLIESAIPEEDIPF